jgi:hypothetical protein
MTDSRAQFVEFDHLGEGGLVVHRVNQGDESGAPEAVLKLRVFRHDRHQVTFLHLKREEALALAEAILVMARLSPPNEASQ